MWQDPIIDDVRKVRDEYAKGLGYDIKEICKSIKKQEVDSNRKRVSLSPKLIKPAKI